MQVHLTLKSDNRKVGPIPVSTTEEASCPRTCPWYGKGCYANGGPLKLHWRQVSSRGRGSNYSEFIAKIRELPENQLWRHNQAGDLAGSNTRIDSAKLLSLARASSGKRGFTYTHKPVSGESLEAKRNRRLIQMANSSSFTINLSANNLDHAIELKKLAIAPVATIVDSSESRKHFDYKGERIVVCPATYKDKNITCSQCRLCAVHNRKSIIAFPAHGSQKKQVNARI